MDNEEWRDIPGLEGMFQASSLGRVRSLDRKVQQINRWGNLMTRVEYGAVLSCCADKDGYLRTFSRAFKETAMHRLVALAFIPNPANLPQINHKNGDKQDNRPCNLEWCNNAHNHLHRVHVLGGGVPQPVVRRTKVVWPDGLCAVFESATAAATALGVVKNAVINAVKRSGKCQKCEVRYV